MVQLLQLDCVVSQRLGSGMLAQFTMYGDAHMTPVTGAPCDASQVDKACEGGHWVVDYSAGPWRVIMATDGPNGGPFTDRDGWPLIVAVYVFD